MASCLRKLVWSQKLQNTNTDGKVLTPKWKKMGMFESRITKLRLIGLLPAAKKNLGSDKIKVC